MPVALLCLATWLFGGTIFTGIGLLFWPSNQPLRNADDLVWGFWTGWSEALLLLLLIHFVRPIDIWTWVPLAVLACLGLARSWRRGFQFHLATSRRHVVPKLAVFGLLVCWSAVWSAQGIGGYDADLYHLQTILWNNSYPVVPGIGNLYGPLAANSAYFLYEALLNVGPITDMAFHVSLGLLFVATCATALASIDRLVRRNLAVQDEVILLLVLPIVAMIAAVSPASTQSDVAVFMLDALIAALALDMVLSRPRGYTQVFTLAVLVAAAILVKLSSIVFCAGCLLVVFWVLRRQYWRWVLPTAGVLLVFLGPWLVTGFLASGYPFYPSPVLGLPTDWQVPARDVVTDSEAITAWAREPDGNFLSSLHNWSWVLPWARAHALEYGPLALVTLAGAGVGLWCLLQRGTVAIRHFALLAPSYLGVAFWFVNAPDPRFGAGPLWCSAALPVAAARGLVGPRVRAGAVGLFLLIALLPPRLTELTQVVRQPVALLRGRGYTDGIPQVPYMTFVTDSGLVLNTPYQGGEAWLMPLPATKYPNPRLALRCANDLSCGFRLQ